VGLWALEGCGRRRRPGLARQQQRRRTGEIGPGADSNVVADGPEPWT
jgi:hypothetical protein